MFLTKLDINGTGQPGLWERMNDAVNRLSPFSATHDRSANEGVKAATDGAASGWAPGGSPLTTIFFSGSHIC